VQGVGETFQGFTSPERSGGGTSLEHKREPRIQNSQRKQRSRPLILREIFQGEGRKRKLRRELQLLLGQLDRRRSGPLSSCPGSSRKAQRNKNSYGPSDLVQGADSHRIQEKVHEV
jgi:hypothetical protein